LLGGKDPTGRISLAFALGQNSKHVVVARGGVVGEDQCPRGTAKGKASAAAAKPARPVPLRVVLLQILKRQKAPMTGSELAREAIKAGYQTTSKQFVEVVWKALGSMDNVENVNGQGYRLKRSK
jgi:hypothetical protein